MSVLPQATQSEDWKEQGHRFLQETYNSLRKSWDKDSMAWTNLHVAGYFNTLPGLTHPQQLAACCLRSNSKEEYRWSCWSCQLHLQEAKEAGFSLSESCWLSDAKQLCHWWAVHGKQSHWDWLREAESFHITHHGPLLHWAPFPEGCHTRSVVTTQRFLVHLSTASSRQQMHLLSNIGSSQCQPPRAIGLFPPLPLLRRLDSQNWDGQIQSQLTL